MGSAKLKPSNPSQSGEFVNCKTNQPCATFCIQVPVLETISPVQRRVKFRWCSAAKRIVLFGIADSIRFSVFCISLLPAICFNYAPKHVSENAENLTLYFRKRLRVYLRNRRSHLSCVRLRLGQRPDNRYVRSFDHRGGAGPVSVYTSEAAILQLQH